MSPMRSTKTAGGDNYANPFVGPIGPVVAIDINIANLTDKEVDASGYLKAGVPLTAAGALLAAPTLSTVAAAVAGGGNTGNATIDSVLGGFGAPAETITVTGTVTGGNGVGKASIYGSKSGYIGEATVGTVFHSPVVELRIVDGATDLTVGDTYTLAVAPAGASDKLFGVTVEPSKLVQDNSNTYRTGTFQVAVTTGGLVNRDVGEDILGRVYTATEIAAFAQSSGLQLTPT